MSRGIRQASTNILKITSRHNQRNANNSPHNMPIPGAWASSCSLGCRRLSATQKGASSQAPCKRLANTTLRSPGEDTRPRVLSQNARLEGKQVRRYNTPWGHASCELGINHKRYTRQDMAARHRLTLGASNTHNTMAMATSRTGSAWKHPLGPPPKSWR